MHRGTHARVVVQQPGWNADHPGCLDVLRRRRTTAPTEAPRMTGGPLVSGIDEVLAAEKFKSLTADVRVSGKRRSAFLAAYRAVAMG
jgi:hypothetical protein